MGEVISLRVRNRRVAMPRRSRDRLRHLALLDPIMRRLRTDREEKRVIHGRDLRQRSKRNSLTSTTPIREDLSDRLPARARVHAECAGAYNNSEVMRSELDLAERPRSFANAIDLGNHTIPDDLD